MPNIKEPVSGQNYYLERSCLSASGPYTPHSSHPFCCLWFFPLFLFPYLGSGIRSMELAHLASSNVNIWYNHGTFIKTKKLLLAEDLTTVFCLLLKNLLFQDPIFKVILNFKAKWEYSALIPKLWDNRSVDSWFYFHNTIKTAQRTTCS